MQHTNEALALLIQSGQTEHIPQLWEQIQEFLKYLADRYLQNYPPECQQLHGDMVNQVYLSFQRAVNNYQPDKGKFTSYLSYYAKNAFREVLQGRTSRTRNEPLNTAVSLDTPIEGTEDLTLADMLIDTQSEEYYRHLEDTDLWRSVHELLLQAIENISETYQDFFLVMLEHGTGVADTLRIMGVNLEEKGRYYEQYRRGLRTIRKYILGYLGRQKGANIALEECISYYSGVGFWRNHRFTSSVELAVMRRNDRQMAARTMGSLLTLQP